jgi:uncharacterized protein
MALAPPARRLGVGVVYAEPVATLVAEGLADFVEVEPQTLWWRDPAGRMAPQPGAWERLLGLPVPKLLHSVGVPVANPRLDAQQVDLLRRQADAIEAPWVSEHLAFNAAGPPGSERRLSFFLPPVQSDEGVAAAAGQVRRLQEALGRPVAIETGVNYLRPRPSELPDGEFVARVAEAADCGILLDLHNVWANERNRRQGVEAFLRQLPLERVWEVHVAGGLERDGLWLDAHVGACAPAVLDLWREVAPRLPGLRAVTFEATPEAIALHGLGPVRASLRELRRSWPAAPPASAPPRQAWTGVGTGPSCGRVLDEVVAAMAPGVPVEDPGIRAYARLAYEARANALMLAVPLTMRWLLYALDPDAGDRLLRGYVQSTSAPLLPLEEAEQFAALELEGRLPHLARLAAYETAVARTLLDGAPREVRFPWNPFPVIRELAARRLPDAPRPGDYEVVVCGEEPPAEAPSGLAAGPEASAAGPPTPGSPASQPSMAGGASASR